MGRIVTALKQLWMDPAGRWTAAIGFALLLPLYATTLPASLTGGHIGWVSLRLLTPELVTIAVALSTILALTLAFIVVLLRQGQRASKSAATGGALLALISPLLCCSPLLPLALGALAVALPALGGVAGGRVQGFIATHEFEFLFLALALSAFAFYQNATRIARGTSCRLPER